MDIEDFIGAGLYDPDADDAADRLALLRYVAASGATLAETVESARNGDITSLVIDIRLGSGELSAVDLVERSGRSLDDVRKVFRTLNIVITDPDARVFDDAELGLLELLDAAADLLPAALTAHAPAAGAGIGLRLVAVWAGTRFRPRGGLAHGVVVARHGDLYGTIVNLAARLADIAAPGELLADARLAGALGSSALVVEPAGRRVLKGFSGPVAVVTVGAADSP